MNIQNYVNEAHRIATEHGFHQEKRDNEHWLMLIITEICEALEAHRKESICGDQFSFAEAEGLQLDFRECYESHIKGCLGEELADICIRTFDFMGETGITEHDLLSVTHTGDEISQLYKTDSFPIQAFYLIETITNCWALPIVCHVILEVCQYWAKQFKLDLQWHIDLKMRYNQTRPILHGRQY